MLVENFREAAHRGVRGFAQGSIILAISRGFRLEDNTIPEYLWHGDEDVNSSVLALQNLAFTC